MHHHCKMVQKFGLLLNRQNGRLTFAIVAVKQNQPASVQDAVRDTPKLLKSRSAAQAAALPDSF